MTPSHHPFPVGGEVAGGAVQPEVDGGVRKTRAYLLVLLLLTACSTEQAPADLTPELTTEAVCTDGVPAYDVTVDRHLTEIGPMGNDLATTDDALWIVESGANSISRYDRKEGAMDAHFIDVGTERNPYAVAVDDTSGEAWVANFAADTVSVAAMDSGEILDEIDADALAAPSGVALTDDYAYVANVNYRSPSEGYGPGSVSIIDRSTRQVVSSVETTFKNPHFLSIETISGDPALLVSTAGELQMGDGVRVSSEGALEWFDIGDDPVTPSSEAFPVGQKDVETVGAPGRPLLTPDGKRLYFTSGIAPVVFAFDVDRREWLFDAASPLTLYEADGDTTHRAAMGPDGLLWVTAFNDDELHLLDTACDETVASPIDLGEVGDMLEGAQAITVADDGDELTGYYLLNIANALGSIRLDPAP